MGLVTPAGVVLLGIDIPYYEISLAHQCRSFAALRMTKKEKQDDKKKKNKMTDLTLRMAQIEDPGGVQFE